ncbi:VacJ family lipoprotein [Candidatus Tisiphia endosymbiont of Dascillus cervinus]|uniref:MlaA family lipoprotein n=1 Tax=Candidatus Tisiphia endosymbiont of Dascillus cervinus TaxID=3066253 RepID=UPI00312CAA99
MKQFILLLLINFSSIIAIASTQNTQDDEDFRYVYNEGKGCAQVYDPYEKLNRKFFAFNSVLDYLFLHPISIGYKRISNNYTRVRVNSFLDNISMPLTVVNYGLQMNYDQTMKSLWRFLINATFGIGGLFDVADKIGLRVTKQTLGSTFAHYGVGPGPYLVIPFFGSTNARDSTDAIFTNSYLNPIMYPVHRDFEIIVSSVQVIHTRLGLLPFTDYIGCSSTDPYIAVRSAMHQNRESVIVYPNQFKCPKPN